MNFIIKLKRLYDDGDTTIGYLSCKGFRSFCVEDQFQAVKVSGETRIPSGRYEIKLRTDGGMHTRYSAQFPTKHKGMLWLQDVPNFNWIYLHYGNTDDNTDGCLLPNYIGDLKAMKGGNSMNAYLDLYAIILAQMDRGNRVFIVIKG